MLLWTATTVAMETHEKLMSDLLLCNVTVSNNSGHILGIIFHVHNIKAVLYRLLRRVTAVAKELVIQKLLPTWMALNHGKDNVFSPVDLSSVKY